METSFEVVRCFFGTGSASQQSRDQLRGCVEAKSPGADGGLALQSEQGSRGESHADRVRRAAQKVRSELSQKGKMSDHEDVFRSQEMQSRRELLGGIPGTEPCALKKTVLSV